MGNGRGPWNRKVEAVVHLYFGLGQDGWSLPCFPPLRYACPCPSLHIHLTVEYAGVWKRGLLHQLSCSPESERLPGMWKFLGSSGQTRIEKRREIMSSQMTHSHNTDLVTIDIAPLSWKAVRRVSKEYPFCFTWTWDRRHCYRWHRHRLLTSVQVGECFSGPRFMALCTIMYSLGTCWWWWWFEWR